MILFKSTKASTLFTFKELCNCNQLWLFFSQGVEVTGMMNVTPSMFTSGYSDLLPAKQGCYYPLGLMKTFEYIRCIDIVWTKQYVQSCHCLLLLWWYMVDHYNVYQLICTAVNVPWLDKRTSLTAWSFS